MTVVLRRSRSVWFAVTTALLGGLAWTAPAYSAPDIRILGAGTPGTIPGHYTVVLKKTTALAKTGTTTRAEQLTRTHHGTVKAVYEKTLTGFSAELSEGDAK